MGPARALAAAAVVAVTAAAGARAAWAFEPDGHEIIEAAAYRRLLAAERVPGAGVEVSGRAVLAALIAGGVLVAPDCFDRAHPRGDCGPRARIATPLAYWPRLGSGALDIIIDRQLNQQGQCQHFMAETADGLSPIDPRLGVPGALATEAYGRCLYVFAIVFDWILREPRLANWRLAGMYALMHGLEDSFSAAHAARDARGRVTYLLSWKLIDWPAYFRRGRASFPPDTHHAIHDDRDGDYLRADARTADGRRCAAISNPYAVPESCLTGRARAAVSAVADLLVLAYRLRARAEAEGRQASLAEPDDAAAWQDFVAAHLASATTPFALRPFTNEPRGRPDVFVGALGNVLHGGGAGIGLWGGRLLLGPAVPFALGVFGAAGYAHADGSDQLGFGVELGLLLPLVRRFAIGFEPAGVSLACDTAFHGCATEVSARLGQLLVPMGRSTWLGVLGPRWSWQQRAFDGPWFGLAFGWSHETGPGAGRRMTAGDLGAWNPPAPGEVTAYRRAPTSQLVYLAATALSTAENQTFSAGLEVRRDRDGFDHRTGWAPALGLELSHGLTEGSQGDSLAVIPTLRAYLASDSIALALVPALARAGTLAGHATGFDVAGRVGLALDLGRVELEVDSPPLSYVSRARWHALPFSVRLGLLFD